MTANRKREEDKDKWFILVAFVVGILIILLWLCSYYFLKDDTNRGTFGDMFGAVNALFSGLALAGIILTILLQRKELKYQRDELRDTRMEFQIQNETLKIQRFENTFFHLLDQHHQIVSAIDLIHYKKKEKEFKGSTWGNFGAPPEDLESVMLTGRDVFKYTYNLLYEDLKQTNHKDFDAIYLNHYEDAKTDFGHYFRNIYRIIKIIDETDFFYNNAEVDEKEVFKTKYRYVSILRAQISDYELGWLFYNCLSENGRTKFKPYIEKYAMFNNLPESLIPHSAHLGLYQNSAYSLNL